MFLACNSTYDSKLKSSCHTKISAIIFPCSCFLNLREDLKFRQHWWWRFSENKEQQCCLWWNCCQTILFLVPTRIEDLFYQRAKGLNIDVKGLKWSFWSKNTCFMVEILLSDVGGTLVITINKHDQTLELLLNWSPLGHQNMGEKFWFII